MNAAKTKAQGNTVSHAKHVAPPPVITEVHLIALDRIEVAEQVRTVFDDDSIRELADDIEERGLLQPVIVNPIGDEKYRLVCGERRLRAIRLLNQNSIPALITKMDDRTAQLAQLAENIQREDLTLEEKARAVRMLFETSGSLAAVAGQVKRSKAWVSKHLAVTCHDFDWRARKLLEDGITEDLELLNIVANIGEVCTWQDANVIDAEIRAGRMNRNQAREWLKVKKQRMEEDEQKAAAKTDAAHKPTTTEKKVKAEEEFTPEAAIRRISAAIFQKEATTANPLDTYTAEQIAMIEAKFFAPHEAGLKARTSGNAVVAIMRAMEKSYNRSHLDQIAVLRGYMDCALNIRNIITDANELEKEDEE